MNTKALTEVVTTPHTEKFVYAILRLLRPIARLVLGRMTGTLLLDLMRRVLVEEACRKLEDDNDGRVTLSEVALLTGIDSRMVKQLMTTPPSCTEADISREAMVLFRWCNDSDFADPQSGQPADLLMFGPGATFQGLVSRVAGRNVTVQTLLERLEKNGNVEVINEHWVRLVSHYYNVIEDDEEPMLESGSFAIANLGKTISHNLDHRGEMAQKWIQQQRWSTSLPIERVAELRQQLDNLLRQQVGEATQVIETHESTKVTELNEVMVGVGYFYWECSDQSADGITCSDENIGC